MKGIRANIKKNQISNNTMNIQENNNNSNNYNYDYDNYNSDKNEEVFTNSFSQTPDSNYRGTKGSKFINVNNNNPEINVNMYSTGINSEKIDSKHMDSILNSNNTWIKHFDEDNLKIQNEAKNLIEKTQNLIDNIGKKNNSNKNNPISKRNSNSNDKNKISKEKEYLSNLDKHLFDALSNDLGQEMDKNLNSTKNSKTKWKSKPKYYEERVMVKSRSPSPPSKELRGLMGKFNSSMINSETNLKSK